MKRKKKNPLQILFLPPLDVSQKAKFKINIKTSVYFLKKILMNGRMYEFYLHQYVP